MTLLGTVRVPLMIEPAGGRGKELPVAQRLVKQAATELGSHAPTLWLADALYFTSVNIRRSRVQEALVCRDRRKFEVRG